MQKVVLKLILICFPVLILLISVNYSIDPANIFQSGQYEKDIAKLLCDSMNVTNIVNYDERLLQKFFIECTDQPPDILILGSSRGMLISSDFFENKNIKNNSVSGASIEDYLAIYHLYQRRKMKPKVVLFCLDPWILNDNNGQNRWMSLTDDYFLMYEKIGGNTFGDKKDKFLIKQKNSVKKYYELVSFSYFQESLSNLELKGRTIYYPTKNKVNDTFTKLTDGSICYNKKYREKSDIEIENEAKNYINSNPLYSLGNFTVLSKRNQEIFESFVKYLIGKNTKILFFLSPYHPAVYDFFSKSNQYKIVLETESYFEKIAMKYKIQIIGSFDPHKFKLINSDFYDGMHCKEAPIKKIFHENLLNF